MIEIDRSRWRRTRFGDVVTNVKETVKDPVAEGLDRVVALEHIEPGNLQLSGWQDAADGTTFTRRFRAGRTLFAKRRAYQRKVAYAEFDGVCSGDILVFEAKPDELLPELLPFIVQSDAFFKHALRTSAGSLSPRTKWQDLATWEFDLPPLDEQRRITELAWSVQGHLLSSQREASALSATRSALARQVFSREAVWRPIGEVAEVRTGTTPSTQRSDYWENGTIPWLPTGKVNDRFITGADTFVTELAVSEKSLRLVPSGSTLVAMIGQGRTRGSVAQLRIPALINQNFAAITPGPNLDEDFLFYLLDSQYDQLRSASQGSNQEALNSAILRDFKIPVPAPQRQRELAARFVELEAATESNRLARESDRRLMTALLGVLMGEESQ